ncbi:DsrE family protein [Oceanidesulfovibrio indonesiensis]|uniref:DsrE family protein n=1 Tax=Oceanidesulfovibrio indonesiensis TaxID=54767 RepID=A0A7M3MJE1_9BACT|nr:DsrE family protein [Oceanidesulfovibrio indonesiensis]TVM19525.1 DsrE family protein [Oceanidesulfovibrio indonesiensis]
MTDDNPSENQNKLLVVWSSGDREVALSMVFMYVLNARKMGWWDEIVLLIWGPSAEVLAMDQDLHKPVKELIKHGVRVTACQSCAELFDVGDRLVRMGVHVDYMGEPLTRMLKDDWKVLTF